MPVDLLLTGFPSARAQTLPEWLSRPVHTGRDELAGAGQRLRDWRSAVSFEQTGAESAGAGRLWASRLAAAGLDEPTLTLLLAAEGTSAPEPAAGATADDPDAGGTALPWVRELVGWYADPRNEPADVPPWRTDDFPFLAVAEPIAMVMLRQLGEHLAGRETMFHDPAGLPGALLAGGLLPRLNAMLCRTTLLELGVARVTGQLSGATPTERLHDFLNQLRTPARRWSLLCRYPVLARQLVQVSQAWLAQTARLLDRLAADLPALSEQFADGADPGRVTEVATGLGDNHRDGQSVATVHFTGGLRVVYKPRPVGVDRHFQRLLEWVNDRTEGMALRTLHCLDRGAYGWVEFVTARPCRDTVELHRFYRRQGGLLALLYLVRAADFHGENIIADGDQPVLVDLETLFEPGLSTLVMVGESGAERAIAELTSGSVLQAGLLPTGTWQTAQGNVDLSGLGWSPGQRSPIRLPYVHAEGTDAMRMRIERQDLGAPAHRPVAGDEELRLLDYSDDVSAGFAQVYRALLRHRDEVAGLLRAFADDEIRVLIRDTVTYAMLLDTSFHPDVLRRGLDRERHFDWLWRDAVYRPGLAGVIEAERRDLWRNDVPMFAATPGGAVLYDSTGAPLPDVPLEPGLDRALATLAELSETDLARQLWLVRSCIATNALQRGETQIYTYYDFRPADRPTGPERFLAGAADVAHRLAEIAVRADGEALWLGPHRTRPRTWSVGALSPSMYDGVLSIAFFLGYYAEVSGDRQLRGLAREAAAAAVRQIRRRALRRVHPTANADFGGLCGLGGMVYALTHLGTLWADRELLAEAHALAARIGRTLGQDTEFAVADGAAGSLLALAGLHQVDGAGSTLDLIRSAADHLVAHQQPYGAGASWLPRLMAENGLASQPLAGFAHGTAGISAALVTATRVLGDERYRDAAARAVGYERELFEPATGNWRDVRHAVEPTAAVRIESERDVTTDRVAWCHGAPGIGIAKLLTMPVLDDPTARTELDVAIRTTVDRGFGYGLSMCHGDFGSLELLLLAARQLDDSVLAETAQRHASGIMDAIDERGWLCGLPRNVEIAGFFSGIAGVGYGLLRAADPERFPSVTAQEPPRL
ncbi:type 2 lanthipeptide synthetase LanM family protein [Micromonospora sonneratiae]|uniref:Type 2 lanthipeptide synthetase LanM family protein n=1 Tax=Micromonospora sonneratiae TaxID=1184706 RepID=A0ABW3YI70_9ACTN